MRCPSNEQLAALYDGALPRRLAEPLREHLLVCPRCRAEIRLLGRLLAAPPAPQAPAVTLSERARALADRAPAATGPPAPARISEPARRRSRDRRS